MPERGVGFVAKVDPYEGNVSLLTAWTQGVLTTAVIVLDVGATQRAVVFGVTIIIPATPTALTVAKLYFGATEPTRTDDQAGEASSQLIEIFAAVANEGGLRAWYSIPKVGAAGEDVTFKIDQAVAWRVKIDYVLVNA